MLLASSGREGSLLGSQGACEASAVCDKSGCRDPGSAKPLHVHAEAMAEMAWAPEGWGSRLGCSGCLPQGLGRPRPH